MVRAQQEVHEHAVKARRQSPLTPHPHPHPQSLCAPLGPQGAPCFSACPSCSFFFFSRIDFFTESSPAWPSCSAGCGPS
eukprot:228434-Prorocentrum_minimum.AAC.1